ncbi:MAG: YcxB family protein, partial [bacterium]|nr:YcxB family protein [bacterium]
MQADHSSETDQYREIGEIRASGIVDSDDLAEAQLGMSHSRSGRLVLVIGIALGLVVGVAQLAAILREEDLADGLEAWMVATAICAGIVGLCFVALRFVAARRRRYRVTGATVEYVFRPTGVEISDPWSHGRFPWSAFVGWDQSKRGFWLFKTPELCQVVPKRFMHAGDVARLESWLRQSLGEPGGPRTGRKGILPHPSSSQRHESEAESAPAISCAGIPEYQDWMASRPASQRILDRIRISVVSTIAVAVVVLVALVFSGLVKDPGLRQTAVIWLAVLLIGLVLYGRSRRAVRKAWENQRMEVSYRLTPRGLVVRFGPEVVEIAWTELESWRESRRTFVFDLGGGRW